MFWLGLDIGLDIGYSPNRACDEGVLTVLVRGPWILTQNGHHSANNFYAPAADLVRVTTLPCTRNGRSRHFRQKNTMVLAHFPSDPPPGLLWHLASQMPPRGEGGYPQNDKKKVLRMEFSIVENISGLQGSIFILFRGP